HLAGGEIRLCEAVGGEISENAQPFLHKLSANAPFTINKQSAKARPKILRMFSFPPIHYIKTSRKLARL
ncbi:MAG: hypothetical protein RSG96_07890, partial [Clostridia bacterium]